MEESIRNVKMIDEIIENDLEEPFHCWVPVSANFVNYKEGIHFAMMNNVVKALDELENVIYYNIIFRYTCKIRIERFPIRRMGREEKINWMILFLIIESY